MKREILFKAKRVDNGEWIEGSLIYRPENSAQNYKEYAAIVIFDKGIDSVYDAYLELQVDPETVCQFTGLLDKNGNKIFEGDSSIDENNDPCYVVQMDCGIYALRDIAIAFTDEFVEWKEVEIIGNIHD